MALFNYWLEVSGNSFLVLVLFNIWFSIANLGRDWNDDINAGRKK